MQNARFRSRRIMIDYGALSKPILAMEDPDAAGIWLREVNDVWRVPR